MPANREGLRVRAQVIGFETLRLTLTEWKQGLRVVVLQGSLWQGQVERSGGPMQAITYSRWLETQALLAGMLPGLEH